MMDYTNDSSMPPEPDDEWLNRIAYENGYAESLHTDSQPDSYRPTFIPRKLEYILSRPAKMWLINRLFGHGDIGQLFGPPGSGKTFVVLDMIFAAITGTQFAMRFDILRPLTVAYCAGEGLDGLGQRFTAAAQHYGVTTSPSNLFIFENVPQLYDKDPLVSGAIGVGKFVQDYKHHQAIGLVQSLDLLVIDTLHSATYGADENSAQAMGKILESVKFAIHELGCAVILVHHSNKAGTGERGSSALRGACDVVLGCAVSTNGYTLECEKLKDDERWKPAEYSLTAMADSARVWWEEPVDGDSNGGAKGAKANDKRALFDELEKYRGKGFAVKPLSEVIGKSDNYTRKLLAELESEGQISRKLSNPNKEPSKTNAWVFVVENDSRDTQI